jgi:hypothetical protein
LDLSTTLHYKKYLEKFSNISRGYRTSVTNAGTLGRLKSPLVGLRCLQRLRSSDLPMLKLIIIFTLYFTHGDNKRPLRCRNLSDFEIKIKKFQPFIINVQRRISKDPFFFSHPYRGYSQIWLYHLLRNATLATLKK